MSVLSCSCQLRERELKNEKYILIRICNDDTGKPVAYAAPRSGRGRLCDTYEIAVDVKNLYEEKGEYGYSICQIEV